MTETLKRAWAAATGKTARTAWRGVDAAEAERYFAKNDDLDLAVPLALAQQAADEVTARLAGGGRGALPGRLDALDLACAQGELTALRRFAELYEDGVRRAGRRARQ